MNQVLINGVVESVEPPIPPNAESKGRKSYRITANGQKMFANAQLGATVYQGGQYQFSTSIDGYGNTWINEAVATGGQQQQPVQQAPAQQEASRPVPQAPMADIKPGICGVLKSCIESGKSIEDARAWIRFGLTGEGPKKQFVDAVQDHFPGATVTAPIPQGKVDSSDLNDSIPF